MKQLATVLLISLVFLSGCATLNKDECLTADWYAIGYEDGANGLSPTRIGAHREACAKHGITPDLRAYQDGYDEGVIGFCTARNGFNRARGGYQYNGICPPSLEPDFLDGYEAGREIFKVSSQISKLEKEQRSNEKELARIDDLLIEKEAALFASGTPEEERRVIYEQIAQLKERKGQLTQRNRELISRLADAQAQLRLLQERYNYY